MKSKQASFLRPLPILFMAGSTICCQVLSSGVTKSSPQEINLTPQEGSREVQLEFGPGSLYLPDLRVGLAETSGYRSKLTLSFEGNQAGRPVQWTNIYSFAANNPTDARQLLVEETGDDSQPPVFMAEMNGVTYEKRGEDFCFGEPVDPVDPIVQELEPAAQLPSLFGAEEEGTELLNGVQAVHYTFDEGALAEYGFSKIAGELWLAVEGGYVLRFNMTTTGEVGYFDENTGGILKQEYELIEINQPVEILLPTGCPPGMIEAPMLSDAVSVINRPGVLEYETASSLQEVQVFYEAELPKLGWILSETGIGEIPEGMTAEEYAQALELLKSIGGPSEPSPTPNPNEAAFDFLRADQKLSVVLARVGATTQVSLGLVEHVE
jgi:hypothetical protein